MVDSQYHGPGDLLHRRLVSNPYAVPTVSVRLSWSGEIRIESPWRLTYTSLENGVGSEEVEMEIASSIPRSFANITDFMPRRCSDYQARDL